MAQPKLALPIDEAWYSYDEGRPRGDISCGRAFTAGWNAAVEAARKAQPVTAEKPDENTYQRGFFDGVISYGRAICALRQS